MCAFAAPNTALPQLTHLFDTVVDDQKFWVHQLLTTFAATHEEQFGAHPVLFYNIFYNMTKRTLVRLSSPTNA